MAPAARQAAALVTGLDGSARLQHAGRRQPLALLATLEPGDELHLAAHARAEVVVTGGRERVFSLSGPGRFVLRQGAMAALDRGAATERDLVGDWRALRLQPGLVGRASISLRGVADTPLATRFPVGAQRAAAVDALRWEAPYGRPQDRWSYTVQLIDEQGQVVFSATAPDTFVLLPPDLAWRRGQAYVWSVVALAEDGRRAQGDAEFRLVSRTVEERLSAVEAAAAQACRNGAGTAAAEEVLLALMLDQAGLRSDADRQWQRLSLAAPADAASGCVAAVPRGGDLAAF